MAILTDNIAPQSNASSMLSKFGDDMQRMQLLKEQKQEKENLKKERSAMYRGQTSAQIGSLEQFGGLYNVAQGMYNKYLEFEQNGDIENAAMVKTQLDMTLKAMTGYTSNFLDLRNSLLDDQVMAGYENSYDDLNGLADEYQNKSYTYVRFENGRHIVKDADGNEMFVEQIPGLSDGSTFLNDETVVMKEALPDGYLDVYQYAGQRSASFLTSDVMDEYGRITDEEALKTKISDSFEERVQLNDGQLLNMIYLDQRAKGNMSRYDQEKVAKKLEDQDYIQQLKEEYVDDVYNQVVGSINVQKTPEQQRAAESRRMVAEENIQDGQITFAEKPLQLTISVPGEKEGTSRPKSLYIIGISKDDRGLPVLRNSVGADGEFEMEKINLTRGSQEWRALSEHYGGEKYLIDLLTRMGIDMKKYEM